MAAWTLPNEGPLTDAQRRQAMGNFAQYIRRHDIKPAQVGRQIGKPKATTINDLIKRVYTENSDAHIRKLNTWIEQHARQHAATLKDHFVDDTKVAREILHVARLVRENKTMGLVVGPTGIGKTCCARALHETIVGSIFITIVFGAYHPKGLTRIIAEKLGVRRITKAQREQQQHPTQLERVIAKLKSSNRLLIVDEAHKLQPGAIELLREIHDLTGIPILLLAVKELHERIENEADPDHGQIYSRFEITWPLTQGHDVHAGGKPLFTIEQIIKLYQQPPIRLSKDAGRYLQDIANDLGRGSLRWCATLLRNAARRARKRQGKTEDQDFTVTADDLEYAETRLKRSSTEAQVVRDRLRRVSGAATA